MRVRLPLLVAALAGVLALQVGMVSPAAGGNLPATSAVASSMAPDSSVEAVHDGDIFTYFSSASHDTARAKEWVAIDLGRLRHDLNRVRLYPREGLHGFPVKASVQVSVDGAQWRDAPKASGIRRPAHWEQGIVDFRPVAARYVRVVATELGRDDSGAYSLQLAELSAAHHDSRRPERAATVVATEATSETVGRPAELATDGSGATYWGSRPVADPFTEVALTLRFAKRHSLTAVTLTPAAGGTGFPVGFRLQYSPDGETFHDVPGATNDHPPASGSDHRLAFEPVRARAVRVLATELPAVPGGGFAVRLAEVSAEVGAPFRTDLPGDFDRLWNELWLQYGAVDDGQASVVTFGNEPNYFEWISRKILWANEPGYVASLKDRVRNHPQNPRGYLWSWGDNPRWPSGDALHQTTNPMYILAAWRIAVWDDPAFLDEVDSSKAADVPTIIGYEATRTTPPPPSAGESLGQLFTVDREWSAAGGRFPTFGVVGSDFSLSIYRDGPGGELVATRRVEDVPDASWQYVEAPEPQPPGAYYLEMTDAEGRVHWWSTDDDVFANGQAYANGEPVAGDRSLRVRLSGQDPFNTDVSQGKTVWEKVRDAMTYLEEDLGGADGLVVIDNGENDGTRHGEPSNYWDNLRMGYVEPYTNVYYYGAVRAMADLYWLRGDDERAAHYDRLAHTVREQYQRTFFDRKAGRFVSTIDVNGEVRDFGLTFLNTEAIAYGLATDQQAEQILSWLDGTRTVHGDRSTGRDIYYYTVAPRANTIAIEDAGQPYWWNDVGGPISLDGPAAWDEHLENGGFILYTAFYDILARHRTRGIDDAFARMQTIADEYAVDELKRRRLNSFGADWRLGTTGPFPESGLVPASFVYTVLGVDASATGLRIAPDLPTGMRHALVEDVSYRGRTYDISVHADEAITLTTDEPGIDRLALRIDNLTAGQQLTVTVTDPNGAERDAYARVVDGAGGVSLDLKLAGATRVTIAPAG